jgi:hypothetical protein
MILLLTGLKNNFRLSLRTSDKKFAEQIIEGWLKGIIINQ